MLWFTPTNLNKFTKSNSSGPDSYLFLATGLSTVKIYNNSTNLGTFACIPSGAHSWSHETTASTDKHTRYCPDMFTDVCHPTLSAGVPYPMSTLRDVRCMICDKNTLREAMKGKVHEDKQICSRTRTVVLLTYIYLWSCIESCINNNLIRFYDEKLTTRITDHFWNASVTLDALNRLTVFSYALLLHATSASDCVS